VTQMNKVQAAKTTHKNTNTLMFTEMENMSKNRVPTRIQVNIIRWPQATAINSISKKRETVWLDEVQTKVISIQKIKITWSKTIMTTNYFVFYRFLFLPCYYYYSYYYCCYYNTINCCCPEHEYYRFFSIPQAPIIKLISKT